MDYGLAAFFIFVAIVALVLHSLSRRFLVVHCGETLLSLACFLVVSILGAALCSVGALWYYAWIANYEVKVSWVPVVLVWLYIYALPVFLVVGLPFLLIRQPRRSTRKPAKMDIADEL
jgi:hypothetical protein